MNAKTNVSVPDKPQGVPRFVDVKTATRYARVGTTKLYDLIATGKIDARKDGGRTFIDLNSVDAYHRSLPRPVITRTLNRKR